MKYIICSIYDRATEAYMRPMFFQTEGQATRMLTDELMRPDSELGQHPEDYALFKIGEFTDHDGKIEEQTPTCIARMHELKATAEGKNGE